MIPEPRDVYVPERPPMERGPGAGARDGWPGPVFTPGAGGRDRALSARVREALRHGPGRDGPDGGLRDLSGLFRVPATARAVVERLAREARDRGCSAVAALRGGLVGAPVAVAARLPLVLVERPAGPPDVPGEQGGEGSDDAGARTAGTGGVPPADTRLGAGDRVLLIDDVADAGGRLVEAAGRVEATGARVAAVAVVAEAQGYDARHRLENHYFMSITRL